MAYDPQSNHRRPKPAREDPAPVDALLGTGTPPAAAQTPTEEIPQVAIDDPPPTPGVTPEPADPPPDKLLLSTGVAGVAGALITLLILRHLWKRRQRHRSERSAGNFE
jgi:hypothetical protein